MLIRVCVCVCASESDTYDVAKRCADIIRGGLEAADLSRELLKQLYVGEAFDPLSACD